MTFDKPAGRSVQFSDVSVCVCVYVCVYVCVCVCVWGGGGGGFVVKRAFFFFFFRGIIMINTYFLRPSSPRLLQSLPP